MYAKHGNLVDASASNGKVTLFGLTE